MIIIPAVDIKNGKCVRLYQGKAEEETVYAEDPVAMARRWENEGAELLHVVDLDGALRGRSDNWPVVQRIVDELGIPIELGGGIRSPEKIESVLAAGVKRVIIGTRGVEDLDFLEATFREFKERIVPAVDTRGGWVMTRGWVEQAEIRTSDFGKNLSKIGFRLVIYTDTEADGTLSGPDLSGLEKFLDETGLGTIAAGGISSVEDIVKLKRLETKGLMGVITGKGLYAGTIDLREAIQAGR